MQENIDDIVNDMRGNAEHNHALVEVSKYLTEIADRIEYAYKRLSVPTPEQWTEIARQGAEIADLKRENARLRAALKPVLEANREDCDCGAEWAMLCMNAMNEAQRIYKEGDST